MAFNETLAERIRFYFADHHLFNTEEKRMMAGLTFMLNGNICVGVFKNNLMCRINPAEHLLAIEGNGCKAMAFDGKVMQGFLLIEEKALYKTEIGRAHV